MLPDDVLLEIFEFYPDKGGYPYRAEWIKLAHVCRRWRSVVFQSPRRLNLRLVCTHNTPTMDTLDIWPPLPLVIHDCHIYIKGRPSSDNVIAALEHNDRVSQICLMNLRRSNYGYLVDSAAMQKPFPELTYLELGVLEDEDGVNDGPGSILPDSFLGGTAPRLRSLCFYNIQFRELPKLLLSTTHLVELELDNIPLSGCIPPEVMATSLSALTSLEILHLEFQCPPPRPALDSRRPPPLTRSILPSLTEIRFEGASEYLEEIFARIDAPRLDELNIFDTPQLFQFISRIPTLRALEKGYVKICPDSIFVGFRSQTSDYDVLTMEIFCRASEWQLSSLEQVCTSSLPPVSTLEDLNFCENRFHPLDRLEDVENALWLELLHPFAAVKNLYISKRFVPRIAPALQELVGGRTTEVLPTLENIFLKFPRSGTPLHEGIEKFVAARLLTSHPVAVSYL